MSVLGRRSAPKRVHKAVRALARALNEVERSGNFVDDPEDDATPAQTAHVRPLLKQVVAQPEVRMAVFLRGGTGLVQGASGATADRTARSIREALQATRTAGRRMALGTPIQIEVQGSFGTLLIAPGEVGACGIWSTEPPSIATRARIEPGARRRRRDGRDVLIQEVLEPLTRVNEVRQAALISTDGLPIVILERDATSGAFIDRHSSEEIQFAGQRIDPTFFGALAVGWYDEVSRALGQLAWDSPDQVVLVAGEGSLMLRAGHGAMMLVSLETGASPDLMVGPIDAAMLRVEELLTGMSRQMDHVEPSGPTEVLNQQTHNLEGPLPQTPQAFDPGTRQPDDVLGAPTDPHDPQAGGLGGN